jgi:hypothetical protein
MKLRQLFESQVGWINGNGKPLLVAGFNHEQVVEKYLGTQSDPYGAALKKGWIKLYTYYDDDTDSTDITLEFMKGVADKNNIKKAIGKLGKSLKNAETYTIEIVDKNFKVKESGTYYNLMDFNKIIRKYV